MFQSNPRRWHCRMLRQDYSNHQTRFWLEWSLVRARHSRIWSPQDFAPDPDQWCKPSLFTTLPKTNMVHLKMNPCKRRFLFESIMFRFHVNFRGGVDWVWLQIGMSALTFEAQRTFLGLGGESRVPGWHDTCYVEQQETSRNHVHMNILNFQSRRFVSLLHPSLSLSLTMSYIWNQFFDVWIHMTQDILHSEYYVLHKRPPISFCRCLCWIALDWPEGSWLRWCSNRIYAGESWNDELPLVSIYLLQLIW